MRLLKSSELRKLYLDFFREKGHAIIPSASLIPENDPTVLFTTAGMHPLVPYLMGAKHPEGTRLADVQKCIRTGDIDEVGDTSHCTFFEMLGNWSLGDYFKKESIAYSWEFLTSDKWLGIDKDKLYFTCFAGDADAPRDTYSHDRWVEMGVDPSHIFYLDKKHNWWGPAGITGPCGPDTEIFYDTGKPKCCPECNPSCDCGKYLEIWNNVFMEYNKQADGSYLPLAQHNVDTGMGLDRTIATLQGVESVYDTDAFTGIIKTIEELSGKHYKDSPEITRAFRIVADHIRCATFILGDPRGVTPSNVDQGYILRRLIRRAIRFAMQLGIPDNKLDTVADAVIAQYGEVYPELTANREKIMTELDKEETRFQKALRNGTREFERIKGSFENGVIDGATAFHLYDTFGFPIDLTELIAREQGIEVDLEAFEKELQAQKERSRNAAAVDTDDWKELIHIKQSEFIGYDTLSAEVKIARYRRVSSKGRVSYQLVFDRTPFYGNSGGQIGDIGYIETANERIPVVATEKENGLIIHIVTQLPENPEATFMAVVDPEKRQAAANNHTATHLMHEALRKVLGTHVEQKGSLVTPEYLRFDFSHFQKVTHEELRRVEQLVNRAIRANYPLEEKRDATKEEAAAAGAMMLFGEKYGDRVRMVRFGTSVELCGGTHVSATGNIGFFKILNESAISAGVRRIEATTGAKAEEVIYAAEDTMRNVADYLNNPQILQSIKKIMESNEALKHEMEAIRREQVAEWAAKIVDSTPERGGMRLMATQTDRRPDFIKDLAFAVRSRSKNIVLVIGSINDGKPTLTVALGDDIVAQGVNAGVVVREAAKAINGGGGGQPFLATAGGKNPDGIQAAIDKAVELIVEQVK